MTRRLGRVLAGIALVVGTGCSVSETLGAPHCDASASSALISGQSVPTASLVACFDTLPTGWEVATVDIGHEGTTVVFDSDRAGMSAARYRFTKSCDIGDATQTSTEFERTTRYEWILEVAPRFRGNRYYRFDGGCVTWEFDFDADAPAAMAVELGNSLQFIDRDAVNRNLRDTFVDADL